MQLGKDLWDTSVVLVVDLLLASGEFFLLREYTCLCKKTVLKDLGVRLVKDSLPFLCRLYRDSARNKTSRKHKMKAKSLNM